MLMQCGTPVSDELPAVAETLVLEVPMQRMIGVGSGVLGAIELLDQAEAETYATVFSRDFA